MLDVSSLSRLTTSRITSFCPENPRVAPGRDLLSV
jgi:hypothetical protein